MEDKYIEFLLENTGIKNKEDILSKYQEESKFRTYCEDDKIIGFVGANIRDLNYKAREYKSTFIADSIVIKDRRREGIYTNLYREFENQVKNELMYALPLQYELINLVDKQDYKIVGEVNAYAKILDPSNVTSNGIFTFIAKIINSISNLRTKKIAYSGFDVKDDLDLSQVDELFDKVKADFGFMAKRSGEWISNRINKRPNYKFISTHKDGIEGYIIYKEIDKADLKYYMVMDILYTNEEALESMYDHFIKKAKDEKVNLIGIWKNPKTSKLIKNKSFQNAKSSFPLVVKSDLSEVLNINEWYLQPIEGETY